MGWLRVGLPTAFLAAIFYGDVSIGLTIPVAVLILSLMFVAFPPRDLLNPKAVPIGAILLAGMVAAVVLQSVSGHPPAGKSDAVVFLPIAYGVLTIIGFRRTILPDAMIWRSLVAGGLLTGAVMLVLALALQPGQYLIPGQDYVRTDDIFQQGRATPSATASMTGVPSLASGTGVPSPASGTGVPSPASATSAPLPTFDFTPPTDPATTSFYGLKELVRNALGRSNYIAVFFVILFTVALFKQSWFAAVFGLLALLTLSRLAIIFIVCAGLLWWLNRRGVKTKLLVVGFLAASLVGVVLVALAAQFVTLPASLASRVAYWQSGIEVGSYSPLFGMPRSQILEVFNFSIIWNPHNIFLWVLAISGIIGLALYVSYLFVALSEIYKASMSSTLWRGVFFGLLVVLSWSLVEIIAMTPAFDILLACLYCFARNRTKGAREAPLAIRDFSGAVPSAAT